MAEQVPPPYPGTDPEKAQLAGEAAIPSAPPTDAQHASSEAYPPQYSASAYPPPPAGGAGGQPPYPPQSTQPTPYPYPTQPYPPAAQAPPAGGTGYPASAPPSSASAVSQIRVDIKVPRLYSKN